MSLLDLPHHDGSAYHVSELAPKLGDRVTVFVRVPRSAQVRRLWARTTPDAEPHFTRGRIDRGLGAARGDTWWRVELEVRNPVTNYRFLLDGPSGYRWLTAAGVYCHDLPDATDFRLVAHDPPPDWTLDAIVYQIFPDRFAQSTGAQSTEEPSRPVPDWAVPRGWDERPAQPGTRYAADWYGGDLDGIRERLDHIAELGFNTLYLTPVFPAPSNHRYNASAFDTVDPLLGGDAALVRLSDAVHARGWRLIGDLTTNHCGHTHPWFTTARRKRDSVERGMFYFDPAVKYGYESWFGVKSLPKLNWHSPELRRRFLAGPDAIARKWLAEPYRLDGWRVDVANMTGRRAGDDLNHEVARLLRDAVTAVRPDALLVAEHCHDGGTDLPGDGWQGMMNYAGFTRPLWTWLRDPERDLPFPGVPVPVPRLGGAAVVATMRAFAAGTSWRGLTNSWNLLGSHDIARIRTVVRDPALVEVAAGLLFTMPGTPMVFAGDELGLEGEFGEAGRRPMPWHRPADWDRVTFDRYRALIGLRNARVALRRGGLRWAYVADDVLVYLREHPTERLLVLAARAPAEPVRLPAAALGLTGDGGGNLYGGAPDLTVGPGGAVTLPAEGPTVQVWRL